MKSIQSFLLIFSIGSLNCIAQTQISRIEILQPTVAQEASSIWRTINDIAFFEEQGYQVHLPKDPLIDTLLIKSKNGRFGNDDYAAIYTLLETRVFKQNNYAKAIKKVADQNDLMDHLIHEIATKKGDWDWQFTMFEPYKIIFTLYGTGGSYDPDEGIITLLTNKEGGFMKYQNPVNTVIHEITHMGMEYSIVQKYNLPHGLKERIVDTFVYLLFHKKLPEYEIQAMGNTEIDSYLNNKEAIASLDSIIGNFMEK